MTVLYHGTNVPFDEIDLSRGVPGKDFGRGFYLTDSLECAERTARQRVDRLGGSSVVRRYELSDDALAALNVKRFPTPAREWALFVRANRRSHVEAADHNRDNRYDVVVGPIANDKLSLQFRLFDKGLISLDAFVDGLKFSQLYMQYSFHTERAVACLKFVGGNMSAEVRQLIEFATQDLVAEIVAREGLSLEAAMDKLYHSAFFKQLTNPGFGLYREGGEYLYQAMQDTH